MGQGLRRLANSQRAEVQDLVASLGEAIDPNGDNDPTSQELENVYDVESVSFLSSVMISPNPTPLIS
jgi:hypothetical protein